jgi:aspartyl/asparaginyl beta-hydroxylase (cupin superfamily)
MMQPAPAESRWRPDQGTRGLSVSQISPKLARKLAIAAIVLVVGLYFIPVITLIWVIAGFIDVMRNQRRDLTLFERYFLGNGITTWLLSPFNLLVDLISYPNKGIWKLSDLPPEWQAELNEILDVFKRRREQIVADIDKAFESGRRGMYVFTWYGKPSPHNIPEFSKPFRYVKTIAVSVFSGKESTTFHYGPLRLTLRVLYNLTPVRHEGIYIECQGVRHYWHDDPLYIFDDTLMHRSVNELDARRYCVFIDIMRPTPVPGVLSVLISAVSLLVEQFKSVFYKNWKMLRPAGSAEA